MISDYLISSNTSSNGDGTLTTRALVTFLLAMFLGAVYQTIFAAPKKRLQYIRKLEGIIGGKLLQLGSQKILKDAGLVKKEVALESGLVVHYYERKGSNCGDSSNSPTLLLCHGMTSEAKNLANLVRSLQKGLPHWRMIAPDSIGHGHDLERVHREGPRFEYPSPEEMGQHISDLMDALHITECCAYGASMGGGLIYFLQQRRPALIRKSVLISPALEAVIDPQFVQDFERGRKNHFCFECRDDVQQLMHDLAPPQRTKHNPIPAFMLEAIWQDRLAREPRGRFRGYLHRLLKERGKDPQWLGCPEDIHPEAERLVLWPEHDFVANHDKGKEFFAKSSPKTTTFRTIKDCGHLFHSNGETVLVHTAPMMIDYLKDYSMTV